MQGKLLGDKTWTQSEGGRGTAANTNSPKSTVRRSWKARFLSILFATGEAVTAWVAGQEIYTGQRTGAAFATGWEVLHCALDRLVARVQVNEEGMQMECGFHALCEDS